MASMRRTLSPVPRTGTLMNGEACQVLSPLSKSSSHSPPYPTSGGFLASVLGLSDSQASFGSFSPRVSRPAERLKSKGQSWKRVLFHFSICFVVGVFIGLTPFISMNSATSLISKRQAFSFDVVSTAGTLHAADDMNKNVMEHVDIMNSTTLVTNINEMLPVQSILNDTLVTEPFSNDVNLDFHKLLIIVTPTYPQPFQVCNLNRLAHTLRLVKPPLLWILVEMTLQSEQTADILRRNGVMYRHLVCNRNLTDVKDRSVHQRNVALQHIETHHLDGIVYFADDDNVYSLDLFEQMRQIRRFGTWTVAKQTENEVKALMHGPVCNGTQVIGWHVNESRIRVRRFHVDVSGFAFNSTILWDPKRWHRPTLEPIRLLDSVKNGIQVSSLIEQIVEDESQMQGLPENCSRVMVWHLPLD